MKRYTSVKLELLDPTSVPADLEQFDYSKLTAIATCPTWGIVRYGLHKAMPGAGRAMALEAGTACHDFFAAHRIFMLGWQQGLRAHADHHGVRLFGHERYSNAMSQISDTKSLESNRRDFCIDILYTSGYVDDPGDNRRTLSNLEMTCLAYLQSWEGMDYPVWVFNPDDPTSPVGIEIPFAIKITFTDEHTGLEFSIAYTGKIDGIHATSQLEPLLVENKTGSRLDDAWRMSFVTSHQPTGYFMAVQLMLQRAVESGYVIGAQIPLPRVYSNGIVLEHMQRTQHQYGRWLDWVYDIVTMYRQHKDDVVDAPMFTHSCNRYFRPCSLISFCAADDDEKRAILEQMVPHFWSPLHEKAGED